ncbi:DUF2267 domain-containing protein [Streptomyces jeddahensis]|uniref:DUF2267 domain-containing protein n=1 Tax=Streptomyces jeddahensis TaxID=1716141 RepID=A0A177HUJ3_9ACTN|nr:DUF2267 domain-containing protein [Streptomyces jeddahensis]OAH14543.1 hypothetical protein STSP_20540 [Streptomyces jeddahensis]
MDRHLCDYATYLAAVCERGGYDDRQSAEDAVHIVLGVLGRRIGPVMAREVATQLPAEAGEALIAGSAATMTSWDVTTFVTRVAHAAGTLEQEAAADAEAVLSAITDTVSGTQLKGILSRIPSDYAGLFDVPERVEPT